MPMTLNGWLAWPRLSDDLLCLILALSLVAGCAACQTLRAPTFPTCPTPTMEMVNEATVGALDDAPATLYYLGQIENWCDAVEEGR
jgi:hypothetical protein